ncbi:hypothetical protein [Promicromonospora sp. NFX87]|uniref:hypothetical protein n=1 Tax=Promicromonospora sp. NFX87 TaxID=3402691 RepID=UPI003AFAAAF9
MNLRIRRALAIGLFGLALPVSACSAIAAQSGTQTVVEETTDTSGTDGDAGSSESTTSEDSTTSSDAASSTYVDGTYSAEGSYVSPAGTETVGVELTIADGVVTAVTVTPEATDGTSAQYQEQFAAGIADEVVGVALDELDVDKVAGSSLTSGGFEAAVAQIAEQASA